MKETNVITRHDGSQVKIVAELFTSPSQKHSIGNYFLHRSSPDSNWDLVSPERAISSGHQGTERLVTAGEILVTNTALLKRVRNVS